MSCPKTLALVHRAAVSGHFTKRGAQQGAVCAHSLLNRITERLLVGVWAPRVPHHPLCEPGRAQPRLICRIARKLERLERDEFDLVGVGRALIVDPDWANKVRDGRFDELRDFDRAALATLA